MSITKNVTELAAGQVYAFQVRARHGLTGATGYGDYSDCRSATTAAAPLPPGDGTPPTFEELWTRYQANNNYFTGSRGSVQNKNYFPGDVTLGQDHLWSWRNEINANGTGSFTDTFPSNFSSGTHYVIPNVIVYGGQNINIRTRGSLGSMNALPNERSVYIIAKDAGGTGSHIWWEFRADAATGNAKGGSFFRIVSDNFTQVLYDDGQVDTNKDPKPIGSNSISEIAQTLRGKEVIIVTGTADQDPLMVPSS